MLISGNMIMGLLLGAFGCLEFVPTDQPAAFVIIGFVLRFTLAIGSGFTLMSGTTIITERFFEKGLFLLVSMRPCKSKRTSYTIALLTRSKYSEHLIQSLCPASGSAGIVSSLAIGGFLFEVSASYLNVISLYHQCEILHPNLFIVHRLPDSGWCLYFQQQ